MTHGGMTRSSCLSKCTVPRVWPVTMATFSDFHQKLSFCTSESDSVVSLPPGLGAVASQGATPFWACPRIKELVQTTCRLVLECSVLGFLLRQRAEDPCDSCTAVKLCASPRQLQVWLLCVSTPRLWLKECKMDRCPEKERARSGSPSRCPRDCLTWKMKAVSSQS